MRELPSEMVFGTSGVSANPSLEIEDPFYRCSVQKQNTAATSMVKIPYFLNHLADRVIWVMVRKLAELPKFLVFNSGTNSFGNNSIFAFLLTAVRFMQISAFAFWTVDYGVSDIFMSAFQMELNNYPHFDLVEDGRLCSMGQHCLGFPRVLYDALVRLGYDRDAPVYRCWLSMAHGMNQYEVSVPIPFDPTEPWSGPIISSKPDTGVELMAHMALTSLCEDHLAATAALPIALLLIRN
jgi:hypothetical protein